MAPEPWYRREPKRLKWELDEFERHALPVEQSYDEEQRLVVRTRVRFRGEPLEALAVYSHGYPYFPPTIRSDRYVLDRHQDPIGKHFCLLEDAGDDWSPRLSAAHLIGKRLRRLLRDFEQGKEAVYVGEADMPEPVSSQYSYNDRRVVLVGEAFLKRELGLKSGTMTLSRGTDHMLVMTEATGIGSLESELVSRVCGGSSETIQGRWLALDSAPRPEKDILSTLDAADSKFVSRFASRLKRNKKAKILVGCTFLEEGPSRYEKRRTWLFAEIVGKRGDEPQQNVMRAQALSIRERGRRLPEMMKLADTSVIVVGAGSVGAPVALELAKAGTGSLKIFDDDDYDVNNAVRHVLPTAQAGKPKAEAVAAFCRELNPFINVRSHRLTVGQSLEASIHLANALGPSTVIVDTTGQQSVARFLEVDTRKVGATLIVAGLTAGSFGADVFVVTGGGPCFDCFERAQEKGCIPKPPEGERSAVTPIGCRHPAFTGAGFEATELAAIVARRCIQATRSTSYPGTDNNWTVLDFRGGEHFQEGRLEALAGCDRHQ